MMDRGPLKTLLVDDEPLAIERLQILAPSAMRTWAEGLWTSLKGDVSKDP